MTRPRLTIRARLTLLYTGLFTMCGAVIVAISYTLVARLQAQDRGTTISLLPVIWPGLRRGADPRN